MKPPPTPIKKTRRKKEKKQTREPRIYASRKLCRLTDLLTGVKCTATSVAKNIVVKINVKPKNKYIK